MIKHFFYLNASQFHEYYLSEQLCEPVKGITTLQLTRLSKKNV